MRDVTPKDPQNSHVPIRKIIQFLIEFAKNPIQNISLLPDWNWTSLFLLQIVLAVLSGALAGIIKFNGYAIAFGIILMPIVSTIAALMLALFLYYYFQFFEKRTEDFRRIFTLVILSSLPFYVFQILSEYFAPVTLIGFGFTALLAVVGLTENFSVSRKRAYQIVGFLFLLVVVAWLLNRLTLS